MSSRKKVFNKLKEIQTKFKCGGCKILFDSAYLLHDHMRDHVEGGSYKYNHSIQTAFPVSLLTEASTQTCSSDIDDTKVEIVKTVCDLKENYGKNSDDYDDYAAADVNNDDLTDINNKEDQNEELTHHPSETSVFNQFEDRQRKHTTCKSGISSKHNEQKTNECSKITKDLARERLYNLKEVQVSLIRIDDLLIKNKGKPSYFLKPENQIKMTMKSTGDSAQNKINDSVIVPATVGDADEITETVLENKEFQYFKKARSECGKMICEKCNKFTKSAFTKPNLLALHNIPFRLRRGRIVITSSESRRKLQEMFDKEGCRKHKNIQKAAHQEAGGRRYICDICGAIFNDQRNWRRHTKIHSDSLKCPHCEFIPISKRHLQVHVKTHTSEHNVTCDECGTVYKQQKNLMRHIRSFHLGERKHMCDVCGKRFFASKDVKDHRLTHFAPSFSCSFCDRKFTGLTSKKRHERIHMGDRRFCCHICNHSFIQSTPYWVHMDKKHSIPKTEARALLEQQRSLKKEILRAKLEQELLNSVTA